MGNYVMGRYRAFQNIIVIIRAGSGWKQFYYCSLKKNSRSIDTGDRNQIDTFELKFS